MTYRNITPEILAKYSPVPILMHDGTWSEPLLSMQPKQPEVTKQKGKREAARYAPRWIAAKAFKRGGGRLS